MKNHELKKIVDIINKNLRFLRENYNVRAIGLFGSTATGKQKSESDIDIMVEFSQPIGFFKFIELEVFLSKILRRKVDLVSKRALKPAIKKEVLKEVVYI